MIDTNSKFKDDMIEDHNKIQFTMAISLFLKAIKLILIIANFTYFIGMGWLILCKTIDDLRVKFEPVEPEP